MWKPRNLDREKPLHVAISEAIEADIENGTLAPQEQLPTQREMAELCGVNLSTITKALKDCERRGLLRGMVGRGTFVTADRGSPFAQGLSGFAEASGSRAAGGSRKLIEMGLTLPLYGQEGRIEDCVRELLASDSLRGLLRYSDSRGLGEHREVGSIWINRHGLETTADDILVTAGSTNALTCCFVAFLRPGDCMAVDALTYPGIISLASTMGIRLRAIEMDEFGMLPEALESECAKTPIRALYLMPNAQNPTSRMMSAQRRDQIAKVIERRALLLFEDDAYGDASEQHPVALSARIPASSVFIAGLSKFLGAGLRISFVAAKGRMYERLESAILSTVWMASPINAQIVATIIKSGVAEKLLRKKRKEARKRAALATEILAGYRFNCQETGLFGWLELPEGRSGKEFELAAREEDLRIFCAERFSAGGPVPQAVRLALSGPKDIDELRQALQILSGLLSKRPSAWETLL